MDKYNDLLIKDCKYIADKIRPEQSLKGLYLKKINTVCVYVFRDGESRRLSSYEIFDTIGAAITIDFADCGITHKFKKDKKYYLTHIVDRARKLQHNVHEMPCIEDLDSLERSRNYNHVPVQENVGTCTASDYSQIKSTEIGNKMKTIKKIVSFKEALEKVQWSIKDTKREDDSTLTKEYNIDREQPRQHFGYTTLNDVQFRFVDVLDENTATNYMYLIDMEDFVKEFYKFEKYSRFNYAVNELPKPKYTIGDKVKYLDTSKLSQDYINNLKEALKITKLDNIMDTVKNSIKDNVQIKEAVVRSISPVGYDVILETPTGNIEHNSLPYNKILENLNEVDLSINEILNCIIPELSKVLNDK